MESLWSTGINGFTDLPKEIWIPQIEGTDAIIVSGGNKFYLSYWMEKSGLFEMLPELLTQGKVYIAASAGSMMLTSGLNFNRDQLKIMGNYYDDEYDEEMPSTVGSAKTLGLVGFFIRPHLGASYFPQATMENIEKWAAKVDQPLYALDDQSAVKVIDGKVEIISSGEWMLF